MTSSHCLVQLCLNCCLNGEQSSIDVSVPLPLSSNTWQDNRGLGRELERAVPNPEEFMLEQYLPCHSARPPGISHWPAIWAQPYRQWLRGETVVSCVNGEYCCCLYLTRNKLYSGFYNIVLNSYGCGCVSFSGLFVFGLLKDPAMLKFAYDTLSLALIQIVLPISDHFHSG